ncbi:MAG: VOC family protein [Leptospiraceae bacterium]|nr:VOC family protein [Leptospiraceae bacterium]MCP5496109.1 VOC family protein [Leptospiraceae bacterium]
MIIVEGIHHINIAVTNLATSSKFYSDLFDFEITDNSHSNYVSISLEPITVNLVQTEKVDNQLSSLSKPTLSFEMDVDDFTDAISEIEEKEIKIIKGPESIENGESLLFADPDNNLIEIFYKS